VSVRVRERTLHRYSFNERVLHWSVALSFTLLMISGFALGYPRAYFLSGLFGGGQTMRFLHPWIGVAFTLGVVLMFVSWAKDMRFDALDKGWLKRIKTYTGTGHTGLDTGRYNPGQKGYFWFSLISGTRG
jgi:formate dehydrogenase subunit gamma